MRIKKLVLFCMLCLALSVFGSTAMMLGGCDSMVYMLTTLNKSVQNILSGSILPI